jgi:hypothetical protein
MTNLLNKLQELEEKELKVGTSRGSLAIQQTQRNAEKAALIEALFLDLQEMCEESGIDVYMTADGPVITLMNDSVYEETDDLRRDAKVLVEKGIATSLGSIAIEFDIKIKNLDYDAAYAAEDFEFERKISLQKKAEAQKAKEKKMRSDAEDRAEKARMKENIITERLNKRLGESE